VSSAGAPVRPDGRVPGPGRAADRRPSTRCSRAVEVRARSRPERVGALAASAEKACRSPPVWFNLRAPLRRLPAGAKKDVFDSNQRMHILVSLSLATGLRARTACRSGSGCGGWHVSCPIYSCQGLPARNPPNLLSLRPTPRKRPSARHNAPNCARTISHPRGFQCPTAFPRTRPAPPSR